MDVATRAVLAALGAAVLAAAGYVGEVPMTLVAGVLALLFAIGWPALLDLPSPIGSAMVIGLSGGGALVAAYATQGRPFLRDVPVVLALAVLLAFVNELARQDGRHRLVESVTGTVTGVLVVTAAAGWVASGRSPGGASLVVTGAVALAVAAGVSAVPLRGWTAASVTTVAGVLGGVAVGAVMPGVGLAPGGALGLATGLLVAALHAIMDGVPALDRRWPALASVALPVLLSGILVYVVGRVLLG